MGKIFDALEKSKKQPKLETVSTPSYGSNAEKVVALVNTAKDSNQYKIDPKLIAFHDPQSIEAETFKVLRTNLLFPTNGKIPRKILVTSALPGDGKSFVTSNLAISIAQGVEEYVLLVDTDIRRPSIHKHFGYGHAAGLSEHLTGNTDLSNVLLKTPIPKLTVLPSGKPPINPAELLSSKRMKVLLDEVANRYDDRFIIIDSPPPSVAPETSAVINFVDGVIVVIKSGATPKKEVDKTIAQIGKEKILGIVLNYAEQPFKKYYGYGKYYHSVSSK